MAKKNLSIVPYWGSKLGMLVEFYKLFEQAGCIRYVETHLGGGSLLLNNPCEHSKIASDTDPYLMNIYYQVRDRPKEFYKTLMGYEQSPHKFKSIRLDYDNRRFCGKSDIEKAAEYYYILWLSYDNTRQGISGIRKAPPALGDLLKISEKLQTVTLLEEDCCTLIKRYMHDENCLLMIDPPYVPQYRAKGAQNVYFNEPTVLGHVEILELLAKARCKYILSGYYGPDCGFSYDIYDEYLWPVCGRKIATVANPGAVSAGKNRKKKSEYVWTNIE